MKRFNHSKPKRKRNIHVIDTEGSYDEEVQRRLMAEFSQYRRTGSWENKEGKSATLSAIQTLIIGGMIVFTFIGIIKLFK
jgi:hypothetical protein